MGSTRISAAGARAGVERKSPGVAHRSWSCSARHHRATHPSAYIGLAGDGRVAMTAMFAEGGHQFLPSLVACALTLLAEHFG